MKTCKKCNEEKELDQYYNSKLAKDGKMNICKACDRTRVKAQALAKKETQKSSLELTAEFVNKH